MIDYELRDGKLICGARELPVYGEYDVVVVGGGMAGVGAALAAAQAGAKTIVVENTSALGGLVTMGVVNIPMDFVSGLGQKFFRALEAEGGLRHRNSNPEKHKLVFDRMLKERWSRETRCAESSCTPKRARRSSWAGASWTRPATPTWSISRAARP